MKLSYISLSLFALLPSLCFGKLDPATPRINQQLGQMSMKNGLNSNEDNYIISKSINCPTSKTLLRFFQNKDSNTLISEQVDGSNWKLVEPSDISTLSDSQEVLQPMYVTNNICNYKVKEIDPSTNEETWTRVVIQRVGSTPELEDAPIYNPFPDTRAEESFPVYD